jgi:hypothetical protein
VGVVVGADLGVGVGVGVSEEAGAAAGVVGGGVGVCLLAVIGKKSVGRWWDPDRGPAWQRIGRNQGDRKRNCVGGRPVAIW